jgi:hypothetical protein
LQVFDAGNGYFVALVGNGKLLTLRPRPDRCLGLRDGLLVQGQGAGDLASRLDRARPRQAINCLGDEPRCATVHPAISI